LHYADKAKPWFEYLTRSCVTFLNRTITDPEEMLANLKYQDDALLWAWKSSTRANTNLNLDAEPYSSNDNNLK